MSILMIHFNPCKRDILWMFNYNLFKNDTLLLRYSKFNIHMSR